jgi:RND superfamily putative drug exporter
MPLSRRLSWVLAFVVVAVSGVLMAVLGEESSQRSPVPVPADAESMRADALRTQFPGGD